jgi:cupin superfamily acireductone dioxygenase involved in methionine salvage
MDIRKIQRDKALAPLNKFIDDLMNQNTNLRKTLDEYDKEEEIAKLKQDNYKLRVNSLHTLSDKESERAKVFSNEHWENCKGNTRYILEGTGIGTAVRVQCTKCKGVIDITDHDNW